MFNIVFSGPVTPMALCKRLKTVPRLSLFNDKVVLNEESVCNLNQFLMELGHKNQNRIEPQRFTALIFPADVSSSCWSFCCYSLKWCINLHRCKGNEQLPAIFSADNLYQKMVWVYQEEGVCRVAYTDTASSYKQSRCCLACGFVTCKLSWLTDISLKYCICWAMMKGLTLTKWLTNTWKHTYTHTEQISESDETFLSYHSNRCWLPACK